MSTLSRVKLVSSNSQIAKYLALHGVPINTEMFLRAWIKGINIYIKVELPNGKTGLLIYQPIVLRQISPLPGVSIGNGLRCVWERFLSRQKADDASNIQAT